MLSSITPLGERGRNRTWGATAALYVTGSMLGGAALGGLLGGLGAAVARLWRPAPGWLALVVAAACLLAVAVDLGGLPLPTIQRQVNEDWLGTYRGWVVGLGFGFQLGLGVVTIVTTAAVYLTWALALLSASVTPGLVIGATFGLIRALPVLALGGVTTPQRLVRAHRLVSALAPAVRRGAIVAQGLAAIAVLAVAGAA
jgi:sulfite exporter TauE/SafE